MGTDEPEYIVHGEDLMVKFKALQNAKVTQEEMAKELNITARAVKKSIKELAEKEIIKRIGSARSGYWEIKG